MTQDAVLELVRGAVEAVAEGPVGALGRTDHLIDDVGFDSFGLLLLHTELEARLGTPLPGVEDEPTVGAFCALVAAGGPGRGAPAAPGDGDIPAGGWGEVLVIDGEEAR